LSSKLGDLILTDKEASGLVITKAGSDHIPKPKWVAVGKVCSPRKLVIGALERAMQRAWGLHRTAQFRDTGENRFVVRFGSEKFAHDPSRICQLYLRKTGFGYWICA
jgi:hypothetical protein